jgi:hypothetical protein
MELQQYVQDAIRTESRIDTVVVDPLFLGSVFQIMIAAGNMLDQIKKNVFYGKPFDEEALKTEFLQIVGSLDGLKQTLTEGQRPAESAFNPRIFHSIVGIATESVEMLEALSSPDFDTVNFLEELGDLNWYEAIGIDAVDGDFLKILETNIAKLRARYPDKFTTENAINRDIENERDILESGC